MEFMHGWKANGSCSLVVVALQAKEHVNPLDMLIKLFGPFEAAAGSGVSNRQNRS